MPSQPTLAELQKPLPVSEVQKQHQEYEDCTPCRLMGSAAFTGLGIYSYASGMSQLRQREAEILKSGSRVTMQARRMGILGLSATMVGLGVYRLVN